MSPAVGAPTTVAAMVAEVQSHVAGVAGDAARQEARDLVAAVVGQPRFWPSLHAADGLPDDVVAAIRRAAARRAQGAPFAYAVGKAAYRYLTLLVDERVLIPRQETELLVDLVLATPPGQGRGVVADVGTGSGALALALASEGAFTRVIATDVAADALAVARLNAERLQAQLRAPVELRLGEALHPLRGETVDVLVSNPPYIAFEELPALPPSVRDWEPPHALVAGDEGMAVLRVLVEDGAAHLARGGLLALEVDARRAGRVAELARASGKYRAVEVHRDLTGRERFVLAFRL